MLNIPCLLVVLTISLLANVGLALADNTSKTALTSIGAVSSLDAAPDPEDPGIGGGFDQTSYFQNRFIPKLADCTDKIESVFVAWTNLKGLVLPRREKTLGSIFFHATGDNIEGVFELTYKVDINRERARTSVYYLKKDGTELDPTLIRDLLETWDIAGLQDNLDAALKCGQT